MQSSPLKQLDLPSEYDSAVANTYRFLNLGWLMISLYVAISLVYLSGAEYRSVIFYALGAPLAYVSTSWIKREPWDQIRLLPVIVYLLWLPFQVEQFVTSPWYSIGFITICASFSAVVFRKIGFSLLLILCAGVTQYATARMNLTGISDNVDTLLLNSYFATTWVLITGISGLFIINNYYRICKELDSALEEVENEYWKRSENISKLNLKDHVNLKLHGTLLNTLIVAQKMKSLLTRDALSQQLRTELDQINQENSETNPDFKIDELIRNQVNFGRLKFEIKSDPNLLVESKSVDLIIEMIREVALNINKHTNSEKVTINISLDKDGKTLITVKEDLNGISTADILSEKALSAMESKSMLRLCARNDAKYHVNSYSNGSLLHILSINAIDTDLNILIKTRGIRRQSLNAFVKSLSSASAVFTLFAIPAFLYLGVPKVMILIIAICLVIHLHLLRTERMNLIPIFFLLALPLTLIPISYSNSDVCSNMESLPWMINSFLGSFLFGSYFSSNTLLRWIPGLILLLQCLSVNFLYPQECNSLLNGTTPGIAIALVLAQNLLIRRSRNNALDSELEQNLKLQSIQNNEIQGKVAVAREKVLKKVSDFADENRVNGDVDAQLGSLISLVRTYLLCSEKFERQFFRDLFEWIYLRFENGKSTSLEIFEIDDSTIASELVFKSDFSFLYDERLDMDLRISITLGENAFVDISLPIDVSETLSIIPNTNSVQFSIRQEAN